MTNEDLKQAMELLPSDEARREAMSSLQLFGPTRRYSVITMLLSGAIGGLLSWGGLFATRAAGIKRGSSLDQIALVTTATTSAIVANLLTMRLQRRRRLARLWAIFSKHGVSMCPQCGYLDRRPAGEPRRCSECGTTLPELPPPEHVNHPPRSSPWDGHDQ